MLSSLTEEWDVGLTSGDPLGFPDYAQRLAEAGRESVRTGLADGFVLVECDFDVLGGSMGVVHGEKVVRAIDRAVELALPVVFVTRSGGARMQEGMLSLTQLSRTAGAVARHRAAGLLSIALHRSPTTGGVLASYGSLADVRAAEAGALVGFAGPRVVETFTGEPVDGRSHSAETALAHGVVDAVVEHDDALGWVRSVLGLEDRPLRAHRPPVPIRRSTAEDPKAGSGDDLTDGSRTAWSRVQAARAMGRPTGIHIAAAATESWIELAPGTDPALRTALATIDRRPVVAIAFDRYGNGGTPTPAGYRLACRGLDLAQRLRRPVVAFVDTPGVDPSPPSENDGLARAIAEAHLAMAALEVPTVSVTVGEGGSGGAQAFSATDLLLIQQTAIFSVIGPEGAAAILERDPTKAPKVAELLRLTAEDLVGFGIADAVVPDTVDATVRAVRAAIAEARIGDRRTRLDAATAAWLRNDTGSRAPHG